MYSRLRFVGNTSQKLPSDLLLNSDMVTAIFCLRHFSLISRADLFRLTFILYFLNMSFAISTFCRYVPDQGILRTSKKSDIIKCIKPSVVQDKEIVFNFKIFDGNH